MSDDVVFLRLPQVMARTGLSRSSIYRFESQGAFPRRVQLGENSTAWHASEVEAWMLERLAARDPKQNAA